MFGLGSEHSRRYFKHEHEPEARAADHELYLGIDLDNLRCLNESREGAGRLVFKPWEQRADQSTFVESDADEELLFNISFTGSVKLKGIVIAGQDDDSHPAEIRLFKNIPQMAFDQTRREAEQTFGLSRDPQAQLEYPVRIVRFSRVQHLSLHVSRNFGAETTRVCYIGLRGEYKQT